MAQQVYTDLESTPLVAPSMLAGLGTVYTGNGSIGVGTSIFTTGTGIPPYTRIDPASGALVNPYGGMQEFIDTMREYTATKQSVTHTDVLDQIDHLVSKLEQTENDLQLNAVRHLKYAKAYLDKMALDLINERL